MVTCASSQRENGAENLAAAIALASTQGVGRSAVTLAVTAATRMGCGLARLFEKGPYALLQALPVGFEKAADAIARSTPFWSTQAGSLAARMMAEDITVMTRDEPHYPATLFEYLANSAPPLLFARGDVALLRNPMAGIVGACRVSPGGAVLAARCAKALADAGAGVVSGGAKGVDTAAHAATLAAGGSTVIVLPQGILSYSVSEPYRRAIDDGRLAIISEFPPQMNWERFAAVTRNATISALADLLCVIEPRRMGGSLRTARLAAAQGKPIFAHVLDRGGGRGDLMRSLGSHPLHDTDTLVNAWRSIPKRHPAQTDLF